MVVTADTNYGAREGHPRIGRAQPVGDHDLLGLTDIYRRSHGTSIAIRYFPPEHPTNAHTCPRGALESSRYCFALSFKRATYSSGFGRCGSVSIRCALERDVSLVKVPWSKINPKSTIDAFPYAASW